MQVSMTDLNKNVNAIINQIRKSGEDVTIVKHGIPVATITPIDNPSSASDALDYLSSIQPTPVAESPSAIVKLGRQRGV